jgi:hypothetical protein
MPWKAISWWALGIVTFALLLYSSQPFHSCLQEADKYYRGNTSQEDVLVVLRTFKSCIGIYILEKNAVITALATLQLLLSPPPFGQSTNANGDMGDTSNELIFLAASVVLTMTGARFIHQSTTTAGLHVWSITSLLILSH